MSSMKPRFKTLTLIVVFVLLAGLFGGGLLYRPWAPAETMTPASAEVAPLTVRVAPVHFSSDYAVQWTFVGQVEARRKSYLGFEVGGQVDRMLVDDGAAVQKGQVLAQLDIDRLRARRAELLAGHKEAQAALTLSRKTWERTKEAFDVNAVSAQQWDEAQQDRMIRRATVQRIEAQIGTLDVDIAKSTLQAPYDGQVADRMVDEGTVVTAGQPVVHLLEMRVLDVRVGVKNDLLNQIALGQPLKVRVDGEELPATVRAILPQRQTETRTVDILLQLEQIRQGVQDGDLAQVVIPQQIEAKGAWLPRTALTESSRGLWACFVAQAQDDDSEESDPVVRLERRQLELLHQEGDRVYVRGTLQEGERVVTQGLHRLIPGQRVRPVEGDLS